MRKVKKDEKDEKLHNYNNYGNDDGIQKRFDELISKLSAGFQDLKAGHSDKILHTWMSEIAKTIKADKSVLFRISPEGKLYIDDFWRAENTGKPTLYDPEELFPYLTKTVLSGKTLVIASREELPLEAEIDRISLEKFGTESFLFFPIGIEEKILGAFLFTSETRHETPDNTIISQLKFIISLFSFILERDEDARILKEKIAFESFLSDLSKDFLSVNVAETGNRIAYWLQRTGETLGADRALVFEPNERGSLRVTESWKSSLGKDIISYDPQKLFPWMTEKLVAGETVIIKKLSDFPEEAALDRDNMKEIGAYSLLILPLTVGSEVIGVIAFSRVSPWPLLKNELVQRFEIIAHVFSTALLRKRTELELAEERERLSVTLQSIGEGVITTDVLGNITAVNKKAGEITGWDISRVLGRHIDEIFIIQDENGTRKASSVTAVLESNSDIVPVQHGVLLDNRGEQKYISSSASPLKDSSGFVIGSVLVFRDTSLERKREADMLKIKKIESLGVLAGGIAHDFNNILTGIMGNMDLALMSGVEDKAAAYLDKANKGCLRAASLTRKLLTFSRGGAPVKENASVGEIIRESIDFTIHGSNIKTVVSIPEDLWTTEVDRDQISQVIQNIILNSIEAMPHGGIISVDCKNVFFDNCHEHPGSFVEIMIKDSGSGIGRDNLDRIFDPYFTTKSTGSGLGLAVTFSIIHQHEGFVDVESIPGEGTEFRLYLPSRGKQAGTKKSERNRSVDSRSGSLNVLVMDDEESILEILSKMLKMMGHRAVLVRDGEQAIDSYRKESFDFVILDITVPGGMGGLETIKALKELNPDVKAMVSSGYANNPVMAEYKKYGFSGALTKPYLFDDLKSAVERMFFVN